MDNACKEIILHRIVYKFLYEIVNDKQIIEFISGNTETSSNYKIRRKFNNKKIRWLYLVEKMVK